MPPLQTTGICLRQWPFSETSQTVSLLTLDHGLVRGLAKGAHRVPGSFGGGFEPLTMGTLVFFHKSGRELETISEWQESKSWRTPRRNAPANRAALAMMDLAEKLYRGAEADQHAFWALHNGLEAMDMDAQAVAALRHAVRRDARRAPAETLGNRLGCKCDALFCIYKQAFRKKKSFGQT